RYFHVTGVQTCALPIYTADYFHITSNNTIYGTQLHQFPSSPIPVVCDMSSDIFSRQLDYSYFSLIYADAQKNINPSGVAVVIIKIGRASCRERVKIDVN